MCMKTLSNATKKYLLFAFNITVSVTNSNSTNTVLHYAIHGKQLQEAYFVVDEKCTATSPIPCRKHIYS